MSIPDNSAADGVRRRAGRNRRLGLLAGPILALVLVASGCSQASDNGAAPVVTADEDGRVRLDFVNEPPGEPVVGGSLSFGLSAETDGWNVTAGRWASSAYIVGNAIYDPLAVYDASYEPQPFLAESFTPNADFTAWTITLRPDVEFHDGTPVNAEAVAANLTAHTKAALTSPAVSFIDTISVASELEVEVTMIKPWSSFPNTLTTQIGYVMAPSMIESADGSRNPVGSGPFVFEEWTPGQSLKTTRNANYWQDGLPYLDSLDFQVLPDIQTRSRALDAGQIQAMQTADASQILRYAEAASEGNVQMYSDDNAEVDETFIALNVSKPPFDDALARQALAYSVDRQALTDQAYEGLFPPAVSPYQPSSKFYVDGGVPEFNPDKARELVAEYEAKTGTKLAFTANILPVPEVRRIGETLQQQAADVGIEVTLDAMDQATLIARAVTGDYQATGFILFGQPLLDGEYVFIADFPEGNPLNFTRNKNPKIVEALDAARATTDPTTRAEAYAEVQRQMATDANFVFMVHNLSAVVFANNVFGIADWSLPSGDPGGRTVSPRFMEAWISS